MEATEYAYAKRFASGILRSGHDMLVGMKNRAAMQLGRKGGLARTKSMSPEARSASARAAAQARWAKAKSANPRPA